MSDDPDTMEVDDKVVDDNEAASNVDNQAPQEQVQQAGAHSGAEDQSSDDESFGTARSSKAGGKHSADDDGSQSDGPSVNKKSKDEPITRSQKSRARKKVSAKGTFEDGRFLFILEDFKTKVKSVSFPFVVNKQSSIGTDCSTLMEGNIYNSYCTLEMQGFKGDGCPTAAQRLSNPDEISFNHVDGTQKCFFIDDDFSYSNIESQKLKPLYGFSKSKIMKCDPNFVVGLMLQQHMIKTLDDCSADNVYFALDTTLLNAIKWNRTYVLQFVSSNFQVFGLCPGALQQAESSDVILHQFAKDLSCDYKTNIYPPLRLVNLVRNKMERDTVFARLKLPLVMMKLPPDVTWKPLYLGASHRIQEAYKDTPRYRHLISKEYLQANGIVAKAIHGYGGHSVFFMKQIPDSGDVVVKTIQGNVLENVPTDRGEIFTFEPMVPVLKTAEMRIFKRVLDKNKFELQAKGGAFYVHTEMGDDGQMTIRSAKEGAPEEFAKEMISKTFFECLNAQSGYQPTSSYKNLIFRLDCFAYTHGGKTSYYVNEIGLYPLSYLLLRNDKDDAEQMKWVVLHLYTYIRDNLLKWPK